VSKVSLRTPPKLVRRVVQAALCGLIFTFGCMTQAPSVPTLAPRNVAKVAAFNVKTDDSDINGTSADAIYSTPYIYYKNNDPQQITYVWWNHAYQLRDSNGHDISGIFTIYEKVFVHQNIGTGQPNTAWSVNTGGSNKYGVIGDELKYGDKTNNLLLPASFTVELTRILYVKTLLGTVAIGADHYLRVRNPGDNATAVGQNSYCTFYLPTSIDDVQGRQFLDAYDSGS
jgi:hypothetical protein